MKQASPAPAARNDGLVARYEDLRRLALGRWSAQAHGLALFIRRGMRAWMLAWSQCVPPTLPSPSTALATPPDDRDTCPVRLHAEVAMLLANMVLFTRQEAIA
jgi:hypothetical protein